MPRPLQHAFTHEVTEQIGEDELRQAVAVMDRLIARLEGDPWTPDATRG